MLKITINKPDDWHIHLRDGNLLNYTVNDAAKSFARVLVMPNLSPPITSVALALSYRESILKALNHSSTITPYMSIYLTTDIPIQEIHKIKSSEFILSAKLYPKGATTNSEQGVNDIKNLYPHFAALEESDSVLQIHGEVTNADIFDREKLFIENILKPLTKNFPKLRISLEHISTRAACDFVKNSSEYISATITPQHLLYNRNHLLAGGIKPHFYCLPILKREIDQKALVDAALSGSPKFFAGTDSAPHLKSQKESSCGCAGVYSAPFAISLYAEVFATYSKLNLLNDFMCKFGSEFYKLPQNTEKIELVNQPFQMPESLDFGVESIIPLGYSQKFQWAVINEKG